jgi:hypothetical protein
VDGRYGDDGVAEQAAETLQRGRALLAEARAAYGLGRRDRFSAQRSRSGVILISNVKPAAPTRPDDEIAEARIELLEAKAAALRGGVR